MAFFSNLRSTQTISSQVKSIFPATKCSPVESKSSCPPLGSWGSLNLLLAHLPSSAKGSVTPFCPSPQATIALLSVTIN